MWRAHAKYSFLVSFPKQFSKVGSSDVYVLWSWSRPNLNGTLFNKFTQPCETYEPTNCCVKKLHNLCKILHKLCNFSYTTVGRFTCFSVVSFFKQRCNSVRTRFGPQTAIWEPLIYIYKQKKTWTSWLNHHVIASSKMSWNLQNLILRYSQLKGQILFLFYCFTNLWLLASLELSKQISWGFLLNLACPFDTAMQELKIFVQLQSHFVWLHHIWVWIMKELEKAYFRS